MLFLCYQWQVPVPLYIQIKEWIIINYALQFFPGNSLKVTKHLLLS